jgi:hypothetical protein
MLLLKNQILEFKILYPLERYVHRNRNISFKIKIYFHHRVAHASNELGHAYKEMKICWLHYFLY